MQVFISWSGPRSERVAKALNDFLPLVAQSVRPWFSRDDIAPGERWASNIEYAIQQSDFGVVCLTPENVTSPWIQHEMGALASSLGAARICPYLIGFTPRDLSGPLMHYQAVEATEEGTWRLLRSLNQLEPDHRLPEEILRKAFVAWWPRLSAEITAALSERPTTDAPNVTEPVRRSDRDMLEEILQRLSTSPAAPTAPDVKKQPTFVFLVHGRAHGAAEMVARYVEKLGLKVVILYEQPNKGRTVIEKFEDHSDVAFTIVLMTGDDSGGLAIEGASGQKPRARQNVVFELGYFVGKLGRRSVLVLHENNVELPSDYTGVVYIPLDDAGAWRLDLARELRAAALPVDLNNAI